MAYAHEAPECRSAFADKYFRSRIDDLVMEFYEHGEAPYMQCCHELQGALDYAREMGDVDAAYYRIFSDSIASLMK